MRLNRKLLVQQHFNQKRQRVVVQQVIGIAVSCEPQRARHFEWRK